MWNVLKPKPEGQKPLRRHGSRWDDNIKMDLNEIGYEGCGLDSFSSEYRPVAGSCEHNNEPIRIYNNECLGSIKGKEFLEWLRNC
jgi:hypothetical protein